MAERKNPVLERVFEGWFSVDPGPGTGIPEGTPHEWRLIAEGLRVGALTTFRRIGIHRRGRQVWLYSPRNSTDPEKGAEVFDPEAMANHIERVLTAYEMGGEPYKCAIPRCSNYSDQGHFIGALCAPCHHALTYGPAGPGGARRFLTVQRDYQPPTGG